MRASVTLATGLIGGFYLLTFVLGFGAMVIVGPEAIRAVDKGGNMAAPLLAEAVGGSGFLGFIAAVAFATILAVVAGLTLSGAAALSHDLWVNVVRKGEASEKEQFLVARVAAVLRHKPKTPIMVRGDRNVDYGRVIEAMVMIQAAGAPNVGLITEVPER